ncbi:MAG: DUF433 domain-containing protein [Anaerolineae bacterium]|nr:DUF433 domain-containing protein [Anaerolineae bacterium]
MTEPIVYNVTAAHITQTPGISGGEPCVTGHRIKVRHVYVWYEHLGMSPDEIASGWGLSLAEVHAALAFAYEHLEEIREAIRQEEAYVAESKKSHPSKLKQKLHGDK